MNVPLCPVCGGRGVVCGCARGEVSPHPTDVGHTLADIRRMPPPCPNGCVPVEVWVCKSPTAAEWSCSESTILVSHKRRECGYERRHLDPAIVRKWCETHESAVRSGGLHIGGRVEYMCEAAVTMYDNDLADDDYPDCHIIAVRIEKLGELE